MPPTRRLGFEVGTALRGPTVQPERTAKKMPKRSSENRRSSGGGALAAAARCSERKAARRMKMMRCTHEARYGR